MSSQLETLAQRYSLKAPIGSGAMATVWRATDEVLARTVAVKILHPHLAHDPAFVERFDREAIAAARLAHPNVIAIYDTGREVGHDNELTHYIVMEHCGKGTLRDLLQAAGALPPDEVVVLGVGICAALAYAHAHAIVHRDLKPANVLIADDGTLKVGDFGIAKAAFASGDVTTTGKILGTVAYISPEQARGEEPDARSDLYSLAVVLYELLVGHPPFAEESALATAMKHLHVTPSPPGSIRADLPRRLDDVLMRALAKDRRDRWQSADEMSAALQGAVGPRRPDAPPSHAGGREGGHPSLAAQYRWLVPALVLVTIACALVVLALRPGSPDDTDDGISGSTTSRPAAVRIAGVRDFDPHGDGSEHPTDTGRAADRDPATYWETQIYYDPLHLQKPGVGLLFDLGRPVSVERVEVLSPRPGYAFALMAGSSPGADETAFETITQVATAEGQQRIAASARFRYWLIWITRLPDPAGGTAAIAEVVFFAR